MVNAPFEPFRGSGSLRIKNETLRLIVVLAALPITTGIIGIFVHDLVTVHSVALVVVGAMVLIALGRGRFIGGSVRIHESQFGHIYEIVAECARMLRMPMPHVYLRDDPFTPIVAVGMGDPYALVISSNWIDHIRDDEFRFLIGRELGHIAAGHTRLSSLLSTNGRENNVVAFLFGAWLRVIEYTADRVGLLCSGGSLEVAYSAIAVSTFHNVGRKIDMRSFADQRREIDAEPALRFGEWLSATPYVTNRIGRLATFAKDPLLGQWLPQFQANAAGGATTSHAPAPITPRVFAGPWRRGCAFLIDLVLILAIMPQSNTIFSGDTPPPPAVTSKTTVDPKTGKAKHDVNINIKSLDVDDSTIKVLEDNDAPADTIAAVKKFKRGSWLMGLIDSGLMYVVFLAYLVVLVGIAGQSFGMMICDLRVVDSSFRKIGIGRAIARYVVFWISFIPLFVGFIAMFRRVQPFEKWTQTRLVTSSATSANV